MIPFLHYNMESGKKGGDSGETRQALPKQTSTTKYAIVTDSYQYAHVN